MKPSGMRAWRRAARKWRHKQNRRSGAPYTDGTGRWYRRQRAWFHQRPAVPHRPFTPRSLVGMSHSAKKRRAAIEFWRGLQPYEFARKLPTDPAAKRFDLKCALTFRIGGADYQAVRAKYRIGERLRPCPGCTLCQTCAVCGAPSACVGLYDAAHVSQQPEPACDECCGHGCEDGHCDKRDPDQVACDGSGVLLARGDDGSDL